MDVRKLLNLDFEGLILLDEVLEGLGERRLSGTAYLGVWIKERWNERLYSVCLGGNGGAENVYINH